ncbi:unnamed protein product [Urochloa humidicola]
MALLLESWKIGCTGNGNDGPSGEQPPYAPAAASLQSSRAPACSRSPAPGVVAARGHRAALPHGGRLVPAAHPTGADARGMRFPAPNQTARRW